MTDAERTKLSGIASEANNYSHPASHPASMIEESTTRKFMTDAEKTLLSSLGTNCALKDFSNVTTQNLGQNGYCKFPNGLLIQWGKVSGSSVVSYTITMSTSFFDKSYKIFATVYKPSSDSGVYSASPIDDSTKTVSRFCINRNYASGGSTGLSQETFDWLAIGRWKL